MTKIERYISHASRHGEHTVSGDYKKGNMEYRNLQAVYYDIMDAGEGEHLLALFNHPNLSVQTWAAAHALFVNEEQALEALGRLEKLSNLSYDEFANLMPASQKLILTGTKYVIQEWNSGSLTFPRPKKSNKK